MTIYVILTIARQKYGHMIFVKSEKAFKDKQKAEDFASSLSQTTSGNIDVPNVGPVECAFERGVYKMEIED